MNGHPVLTQIVRENNISKTASCTVYPRISSGMDKKLTCQYFQKSENCPF